MNGNEEYMFCPKCGALMKDGVCMSCGNGTREASAALPGQDGEGTGREGFDQRLQQAYGAAGEAGAGESGRPEDQAASDPNQGMTDGQEEGGQSPDGLIRWNGSQLGGRNQERPADLNGRMPGQPPVEADRNEDQPFNQNHWNPGRPADLNGGMPGQLSYGANWNGSQPFNQNPWNQGGPAGSNGGNPGQPFGGDNRNEGHPFTQNPWNQGQPGGPNGWNQNRTGTYGPQGYNGQGAYQNRNYGQPGDYGAWNGRRTGYGQPVQGTPSGWEEKRNDHRTVAAIVAAVIAVLLCVAMVLLFFIVKNSVRESGGLAGNKDYFFSDPPQEQTPGADEGWQSGIFDSLPEEDEEYIPSAEDEFYVKLADSVRDDLTYSIKWEEYHNEDDTTGATAVGRYPQIEGGNIPHLDELNDFVKEEATYYSNLYGYYREWGNATLYAAESMGYVTYMDEEKISIVLQESIATEDGSNISLYSINIDLMSGEIMNNGGIIEYSEELTRAFRDQNDYQNGYVRAVDVMSDEKLQDFLSDEDTNIVFFTPVGLEIGFNYTTSDSSGWVTATIRDYDRYRKKF